MPPKNNTSGRVRLQSVCLRWNRAQTRADVRSRQCETEHNYCLSPRWQTEFIQRPFYANKISSEMQIFIVFLSRVNLSIFLSGFLPAQPLSRKIVGTIMFINCVPFQLILSFGIIIFNLKCCDTVYQLKMFRFKTELDSELKSKTASTNIVLIKVIINEALMDGDIRKKSRCHIFQPLLWQIKF